MKAWTARGRMAKGVMRGALVTAATALAPAVGWACSCREHPIPDFWTTAGRAKVVVVGEVTRHVLARPESAPNAFEIRVLESLKGHESRPTIELISRSDDMCSVPAAAYEIGSRYAIVLMPGDPRERSLSRCLPRLLKLGDPSKGTGDDVEEVRAKLRAGRTEAPSRR